MKRTVKLFIAAFILAAFAAVICLTVSAEGGITQFAVGTASATDASELGAVKWYLSAKDGKYYIFLPNGTDSSNLTVWFNSDEAVFCGETELVSGQATDVFASGGDFVLTSGGNTYNVSVLTGSGISTVYINTESGSLSKVHADKDYKEPGEILIINSDGEVQYDGALDYIKGRGNSTWLVDKKPYNIKLSKKTDLFGMGKSKKWCLLANASDSSMVKNPIAYRLSQDLGNDLTSDTEYLNFYVNGEYQGVYMLTEKVEIGENRIDIYDLEGETEEVNDADLDSYKPAGSQNSRDWGKIKYANIPNDPDEITGGYLLELEKIYRYVNEPSGFITKIGQCVVVKSPEFASKAQVEYISGYYQEFENALYSSTGYNDLGKHYSEYLDMESLAQMYVIAEFANSFDGCSSSFFLYKDVDGKLVAGPLWDYDLSFGYSAPNDLINHVPNMGDPNLLYIQTCFIGNHNENKNALLAQAFSHEDFRAIVHRIWNEKITAYIDTLYENIDTFSSQVRPSIAMNAVRWNTFGTTNLSSIDKSYTNSVNAVRNHVKARFPFLSEAYSPDTYYVIYDVGQIGKTLVRDTTLYKDGDTLTVAKGPASSYSFFTFGGWTTNPDGSGDKYDAGRTVSVSGSMKLYALWNPDEDIDNVLDALVNKLRDFFVRFIEFFSAIGNSR